MENRKQLRTTAELAQILDDNLLNEKLSRAARRDIEQNIRTQARLMIVELIEAKRLGNMAPHIRISTPDRKPFTRQVK